MGEREGGGRRVGEWREGKGEMEMLGEEHTLQD